MSEKEESELDKLYRMVGELRDFETKAREALQAADNFLDYSHAGTGNQSLAYRYVKELIKKSLSI